MKKNIVVLFLIVILSTALIAGCNNQAPTGNVVNTKTEEFIKIGYIGPLTGDVAYIGEGVGNTVQLAVEEVNAAGGINGKKIKLILEDGKCNNKDAANAANKLVYVDKVGFIIGGGCSSETLGAAPIVENSKTVLMSYSSTSPDITNAGDYVFRVVPSDLYQGAHAAEYAYNTLGVRKVALMACLSDWCVGLKDTFSERFIELGGKMVFMQDFPQNNDDFRTMLVKVKKADPEMIYFLGYVESSVNALQQMNELGIDIPIMGGDTWDIETIWDNVNREGALYIEVDSAVPENFENKFKSRFGQDKDVVVYAIQGYDIVKILTGVIKQVGEDPEKVKSALYNLKPYSGISGLISFDENGDLVGGNYRIMTIKNGEQVKA